MIRPSVTEIADQVEAERARVADSPMTFGVLIPKPWRGTDPRAVGDFAQAVEELGFGYLEAIDHVLGANRPAHPDLRGPYGVEDPFLEPLALFAYLAGLTRTIGFVTGVVVLPQRQTALVAKQAAVVDVLSGGRLRLGIGTGWNWVEYEALGENFRNRGRRSEEQIAVLRALWTKEVVTFHGEWHTITAAGINPLPIQRPIPIWIGGQAQAVGDRVGRLGDGWITVYDDPDDTCRTHVERILVAAELAGRSRTEIGLAAWMILGGRKPDAWAAEAAAWRALGFTHLTVTLDYDEPEDGLAIPQTIDAHLTLLQQYRDAVMG
jgi:probable F420-dependent oxidoreductase